MGKQIKNTNSDIDFEIQFYEAILQRAPDFIEAMSALADLYTKKGMFRQGLELDLRLNQMRPGDAHILYNLACDYSLMNDIPEALAFIKNAIEAGYDNFAFLEQDHDLSNLMKDPLFREYLARIKKSKIKV